MFRPSVRFLFFKFARIVLRIPLATLRAVLWSIVGVYLALAVAVLSVRYFVLPNIENYRSNIEYALSSAVGVPVHIAHIDAHWQGLRPHLALQGVEVSDAEGRSALTFDRVETDLAWASLWHFNVVLHRLEIHAPSLSIRRDANGKIFVAGIMLNPSREGGNASDWLLAQHRIVIRDAAIRWEDQTRAAPPVQFNRVNVLLQNSGSRHRFAFSAEPPPELAARLNIRGDLRGRDFKHLDSWRGQLYAELDYADLAGWRQWVDYPVALPRGVGGVRVWAEVDDRKVASVTADIALRDVQVRLGKNLPMLDLQFLSGRVFGQKDDQGFEVGGKALTMAIREGIKIAPSDIDVQWRERKNNRAAQGKLIANGLDLDALMQLSNHLPLGNKQRQLLAAYAPTGRLFDLRLKWTGDAEKIQSYALQTRFEGLGLSAKAYLPGFASLSGNVEATENGGHATLHSQHAELDLPSVFPERRMTFEQLDGQIDWTVRDGIADVQIANLAFNNQDASGNAYGRYRGERDGPGEIDLSARLTRAHGSAVWRYMPLAVNEQTRSWLRDAISGGKSEDVRLRLKGDLRQFPFPDNRDGIFQVAGRFDGATLRYAPGWPEITDIAGSLLFEGKRMLIQASTGKVFGVAVKDVSAEIPDLLHHSETLVVKGQANGPTAGFLRFVEQSPVATRINRFTDEMLAEGDGTLALKLVMPLRRLDNAEVTGEFSFLDNRVVVDPALPPLDNVTGKLDFTRDSLTLRPIRASLLGGALRLSGSTRPDADVAIAVQGSVSASALRARYGLALLDHLSGSFDYHGAILARKRGVTAVLESNLQGLASALPPPFNKSANDLLSLRVERKPAVDNPRVASVEKQAPRSQMNIALGQTLNAQFVHGRSRGGASIERGAIGIGEKPVMPERGVRLAISAERLDGDLWRRILSETDTDANSLPITAVVLKTKNLNLLRRPFSDVSVRARLDGDEWQAKIDSREVAGELAWQGQGGGRLKARFKRLTLQQAESSNTQQAVPPPKDLPDLDVVAEMFTLGERPLGRMELLATNNDGAWRLDRVALANSDGNLIGNGRWQAGGTQLDFKLDVLDIGKFLERFGYVDSVRRGSAKLEGKLSWTGSPLSLDDASLGGELKLEAANGQFNKLEPGVGKLLGILSLQALPRRISLDFRDIFSSGLAFDSITGTAKVSEGRMVTNDLRINSPAAKIAMSGEVRLADETQSLHVKVQPAVGDVLTIGAFVANPAAGLAALIAQKVLNNPLDQAFGFEYKVTGTWSDPKVEKIEREAPQQSGGAG